MIETYPVREHNAEKFTDIKIIGMDAMTTVVAVLCGDLDSAKAAGIRAATCYSLIPPPAPS